jgi:hypothetical protein
MILANPMNDPIIWSYGQYSCLNVIRGTSDSCKTFNFREFIRIWESLCFISQCEEFLEENHQAGTNLYLLKEGHVIAVYSLTRSKFILLSAHLGSTFGLAFQVIKIKIINLRANFLPQYQRIFGETYWLE